MAFELHVDDGADDLGDASGLVGRCSHKTLSFEFVSLGNRQLDRACRRYIASAPEMISISSLVIIA